MNNPNPAAADVELGSDNLVLQPPNLRPGQPSTFAPGWNEGIFVTPFGPADPRQEQVTWYLLGAIATVPQNLCEGSNPPVNLTPPRIVGDAAVGQTLTLELGTWSASTKYVLYVDACDQSGCEPVRPYQLRSDVSGAQQFDVTPDLASRRLRLRVVSYSWRGITSAASDLSDPVTGSGTPAAPVQASTGYDHEAPLVFGGFVLAPPYHRDWTGFPRPSLSYQWQRCDPACADIAGATGPVQSLTADDVGTTMRVVVSASNASGTGTSTSTASTQIPSGALTADAPPTPVSPPRLTGTAQVGKALAVADGVWGSGQQLSYRWQRCAPMCTDIAGAAGATYVPSVADVGGQMRAVITSASDASTASGYPARYAFATEPSAPVAPVAPGAPANGGQGAPPPAPPSTNGITKPDRTAPVLTHLHLSRTHFRVSLRATALAAASRRAPQGTQIMLDASEPAWLRIDIRRAGRRRTPLGTLTRTLRQGANTVAFSGRLGTAALRPGRYVATVTATDPLGNRSRARRLAFTVVRR